eukprot:EG_transcript_19115
MGKEAEAFPPYSASQTWRHLHRPKGVGWRCIPCISRRRVGGKQNGQTKQKYKSPWTLVPRLLQQEGGAFTKPVIGVGSCSGGGEGGGSLAVGAGKAPLGVRGRRAALLPLPSNSHPRGEWEACHWWKAQDEESHCRHLMGLAWLDKRSLQRRRASAQAGCAASGVLLGTQTRRDTTTHKTSKRMT